MEKLHNNFIKIKPIIHKSFISSEKDTYNELGIVLMSGVTEIAVGDTVKFDSWLAKKFPVEGKEGEFDWYINANQVVSSTNAE